MFTAQQLREKVQVLKSGRTYLESQWALTLRYVNANRNIDNFYNSKAYSSSTQGSINSFQQSIRNIYDHTGSTYSSRLASYFHSSLTNPHVNWMSLTTADRAVSADDIFDKETFKNLVKLQKMSNQCHLMWSGSNLHKELYPFYKDLVDIGVACMGVYETRKQISFRAMDIFSIYFEEDSLGEPKYVYAMYSWSARELINYFVGDFNNYDKIKDKLGSIILQAYLSNSTEQFKFIHAVYPEAVGKKEFTSAYLFEEPEKGNVTQFKPKDSANFGAREPPKEYAHLFPQMNNMNAGVIKYEKLEFNPYLVVRIRKQAGQLTGNGFSMEALPALLVLQQLQRMILVGAHKNVEPALNIPTRRYQNAYSTNPNAQNPVDTLGGRPVVAAPTMPPVDLNSPYKTIEIIIRQVSQVFLNDLIETGMYPLYKTATEVEKKAGEEVKLLSPVIGALESEFLRPLTERTVEIMSRVSKGEIKKSFSEINVDNFDIQYISDIARAQSSQDVNNLIELYTLNMEMSEKGDPSVKTLINLKKLYAHIWLLRKAPLTLLNDPTSVEEATQTMNEQAKQQEQVSNMETMKSAGAGYKDMMIGEQTRRGIDGDV